VTLEGHVDHDFQRREVGRMVRHVRGVNGVFNDVTVTPPVAPERVAAQIEEAFSSVKLGSMPAMSGWR
jgi:osmotically-inducible protein OsmY